MNNYKVAHYALLQRGKRYYNVDWLIHYKAGQSLLNRGACITKKSVGQVLQINRCKNYYKVGLVVYYKVGQSLLQSGG